MSEKLLTLPELVDIRSQFDRDLVISGGCIRDMFLGLPPKDIDVFVDYGNRTFGFKDPRKFRLDPNPPRRNAYEGREFWAIGDWIYGDRKVNIIYLQRGIDIYEHISGFDAGINMAYYDGYLVYPNEFIDDVLNKKITLYQNTDRARERAQQQAERLGFTIDDSKIRVGDAGWGEVGRQNGQGEQPRERAEPEDVFEIDRILDQE